ncbi:MAG: hypothetical protein ACFFD4_18055 [Candidatus Odinarchaeota archaeon]
MIRTKGVTDRDNLLLARRMGGESNISTDHQMNGTENGIGERDRNSKKQPE